MLVDAADVNHKRGDHKRVEMNGCPFENEGRNVQAMATIERVAASNERYCPKHADEETSQNFAQAFRNPRVTIYPSEFFPILS